MTDAIQMLNQLIVKLPDFLPPYIEKLKLYMSIQNWSEVLETADRILDINTEFALAEMVSKCICISTRFIYLVKIM